MYLLDTNVVSEVRRSTCDEGVRAWWEGVTPEQMRLSVLTIGEVRQGITRLERRDPGQAVVFEAWLDALQERFGSSLLPVTAAIAQRWGRFDPAARVPVVDGLMAATALEAHLILVTRNVGDVARTGVRTLNPFSGTASA